MEKKSIYLSLICAVCTLLLFTSCNKEDKITPEAFPQLETEEAREVTATTAIFAGRVTDRGDSDILVNGFCWSESPEPTLDHDFVEVGSDTTRFTEFVTGLKFNTTYYLRAFATNQSGTGYGNEIVFTTAKPEIGDAGPGGGLIFYLNDEESFGLEAAPVLQSYMSRWGCGGVTVTVANDSTIGSGFDNTKAIVKTCNTPEIAARLCDNLVIAGYNDWYLPSKHEINLIYENLHREGLGNFGDLYYWSSTQRSGGLAWVQNFHTGTFHSYNKSFECRVHAIRTF